MLKKIEYWLRRKVNKWQGGYDTNLECTAVIYLKLSQVEGVYDNKSIKELIIEDKGYRWAALIADIPQNGVKRDIYIQDERPHNEGYSIKDGNHRLRILKYLYPKHNVMRFKLKPTQ